MTRRGDLHKNWKAVTGKMGLRFIELEEIKDSVELRSAWPEKEEQERTNNITELKIKLHLAMTQNRQERELHDQLLEQEQSLENMINEETAAKSTLVRRVKELKQEVERLKALVNEEEDDKPDQMPSLLRNTVMSQTRFMKKLKEESNELQKQRRKLTVQHNELVAQRRKTLDSLHTYTAAEVRLKVELEKVKKAVCFKDEEIRQICTGLKNAMKKMRSSDVIKELVLDCKNIFDGIKRRQGRVMSVQKLRKEGQSFTKTMSPPQDPVIEKKQEKKNSTRSAGYIWKVTRTLTMCGLCMLIAVANLAPLFRPNYHLWTVLSEAVESYSQLELAVPCRSFLF